MRQIEDVTVVTRNTLTSQIYEAVKAQIMNQRFLPGEKVTIDRVARSLNCSAVSVREALTRLNAEKLLEFSPYRGYVVTDLLDAKSFRHLYEVREMIEIKAVEKAVHELDARHFDGLAQILSVRLDEDTDATYENYQPFLAVDQEFHRTLVNLSGNSYLVELWDSLHVHLHLARFYWKKGFVDFLEGQREHAAIISALAQGDAESAKVAMTMHLAGSFERLFPEEEA